jgi:peptidyl-prolyl cis-trans isomerase C
MAVSPGRAALAAATTALLIILAACDREAVQDRGPPQPGDTAAARVDGQTIWASDVKREAVKQGLIGEGEPLDPSSDLFRRTLDDVIDEKLLAREALRRHLDKTPLAQRRLAAARERILGDMLVERAVDADIKEDAVRGLYDEQLRLARQTDEFHARLILLKTRADADQVMKLLAAGGSFEALAMDRSLDAATRLNGGDLGYFTTDVMPAYAEALKTAKAGDTVGPIQTDGGFAILRVEDRRQEQPPTLEQARPQITRYLTYEGVLNLLRGLRKDSKVQILIKTDPLNVPGAPREPASAPPVPAQAQASSPSPASGAPASSVPAASASAAPTRR